MEDEAAPGSPDETILDMGLECRGSTRVGQERSAQAVIVDVDVVTVVDQCAYLTTVVATLAVMLSWR